MVAIAIGIGIGIEDRGREVDPDPEKSAEGSGYFLLVTGEGNAYKRYAIISEPENGRDNRLFKI